MTRSRASRRSRPRVTRCRRAAGPACRGRPDRHRRPRLPRHPPPPDRSLETHGLHRLPRTTPGAGRLPRRHLRPLREGPARAGVHLGRRGRQPAVRQRAGGAAAGRLRDVLRPGAVTPRTTSTPSTTSCCATSALTPWPTGSGSTCATGTPRGAASGQHDDHHDTAGLDPDQHARLRKLLRAEDAGELDDDARRDLIAQVRDAVTPPPG